jgi:hypothetical protein
MDETWFCSPPTKGKRKKIVSAYECPMKPVFREPGDLSHVTLVATITLSLEILKPMFVATRQVHFGDQDLQTLRPDIIVCKTRTGCQAGESIAYSFHEILAPFDCALRESIDDPILPVFRIMENCELHKTAALLDIYVHLDITVVSLLPHSSPFLQPLDLSVSS